MKMNIVARTKFGVYKILAKILVRRLKANISKVISDTQSAFIEGRQILDGVLLANEIIDILKKHKRRDGEIILKLDFEKAYDCVNWKFLDYVMGSIGFGYKWRKWIMECISTAGISVLVNGSTTKQFRMKRGLRQRDPFSPYLFLMVVETLHLMLRQAERLNLIKGISCFSFEISISQL